jgi:hypothetical protein
MGRRSRRSSIVLGLGAIVLALAGCDQFLPDPIAFTLVDETPVFRICLPSTISSITLQSVDEKGDPTTRWRSTGTAPAEGGAEFALGSVPAGMNRVAGTADSARLVEMLGDEYRVLIDLEDEYGQHEFTAWLDAADLQAGGWVTAYGSPTTPCVRPECAPGYACFNVWPQPTGTATAPTPRWTPEPTP